MKKLQILVLFLLILSGKTAVLSQNRLRDQVLVRGNVEFGKTFYYETGKLADSSKPGKDAIVIAVDKNGNKYSANTDEKGRYEMSLPVGEYQIKAFIPTNWSVETSSDTSNLIVKKGKKIKLNFILVSRGCG